METLIHLWDLRTAGGLEVEERDSLWFDAVAEVAQVMQPRQVRLNRVAPAPARLVFHAPSGQLCELETVAPHTPLVTITAPARELALLVWGRASLTDEVFEVHGDRDAAQVTLDAGLTP